MADRIILALPRLYELVRADLGPGILQPFGWGKPTEQGGPSRQIVWVPGDDRSGDLGVMRPPKLGVSAALRSLATLRERFTCYIKARDESDLTDELLQYEAARKLFDDWRAAVYRAAYGTHEIVSAAWHNPQRTVRKAGATIRVLGSIDSMIPDREIAIAPANVAAHVTPKLLNTADQVEIIEAE